MNKIQHISFITKKNPLVSYERVGALQNRFVQHYLNYKANKVEQPPKPTIITSQVCPVYTLGRRESSINFTKGFPKAKVVKALRGGQTTFHGPGQILAYPIIDLKSFGLSPREYVSRLEQAIIATCKSFGIEKAHTTKNTGVWVTENDKIAAIGIHLRRNITSHGLALNVSTDLKYFNYIVGCGLYGKNTTSFKDQGVFTDLKSVEKVLVNNLDSFLMSK
ncbi:putative octanoyltransferase [Schizosaccharomyces pombe]|uniref:Probable octanoyltransferase n=1 Tax=Schizosaccharomyces pombe (strain 972 / ATCC 24843) TaxID=284812 RepID=LIPB_SCHPO|nr:putative lipoate-protein ligase [Schizosaccharomyces pombe]O36017.1 RecName: Full=Probable octanoyltransferase; AltName: Full=Lipoate biosynthesis protein; AltName: Full=Lipoate-protein ligase; AltName: Full=Lipoyl ligase; AltName: Full=Lipoyl/octanoyl transferase; AltName: Full=Octanoyl-[acyl-carrier-protein]-protein N-octanoyltransferase [Schizosaccharomyces pombe 972h-]CAB11708.1 mitochondrial lipoate-protein ligase (predicted) [Schizosaccharomyces pombe]|eukprot:NP_594748.1 putative lipoate-protein ligase [Schizosaccharomyces pombe]